MKNWIIVKNIKAFKQVILKMGYRQNSFKHSMHYMIFFYFLSDIVVWWIPPGQKFTTLCGSSTPSWSTLKLTSLCL